MVAVSQTQPAGAFEGVYDVPEVARYLRAATGAQPITSVNSQKLIRWVRRGLTSSDLADISGHELLIGFEDLVSMRVIIALRAAGVTWSEIEATKRWLREKLGIERPFAAEILWTGQGQLYTEWSERLISASRHGQLALGLLWKYLIPVHGLTFDGDSGLAVSWEPVDLVVLEPRIQFGAPCVRGTRIPTRTISGMVDAGDPPWWVADAYGITPDEVQAACDWEARLNLD